MVFVEPGLKPDFHWYSYVAYFFSGAFLVNAIPHFVQGVSGRSFPSPFSSPPGKGRSSPIVNVLWGTANVVVGYILVRYVGVFHVWSIRDVVVLGAGGLLMALMLAHSFGELYAKAGVHPQESGLGAVTSARESRK